jgi:hypothetical protein
MGLRTMERLRDSSYHKVKCSSPVLGLCYTLGVIRETAAVNFAQLLQG